VEVSIRKRLILCLDGTWNTRDSGTNVYHLSNLIQEDRLGPGADGWTQTIYYDEGVGTGLLDRVTGGAFGIGLSDNVRQAYDWLVEHYDDGDEVYVFGFSRGAFTARSLVGLIAKCGLLRRGAPIPTQEMWSGYQILGRYGNAIAGTAPALSLRERLFRRTPRSFRSIWTLRRESWEPLAEPAPQPPSNRAERLFVRWSRRIPIRCVGVFDTVGSMGLDALAIPWLRDRTALIHDTQLTPLIVNGYHALALDEHRANFEHIPWHAEPEHTTDRTRLGGELLQRWFVGAHSNVGGGYEHEVLARLPLEWMIARCGSLGLRFRTRLAPVQSASVADCIPLHAVERVQGLQDGAASLRDSYAEFAGGLWQHVVRSKRSYRVLAPAAAMIDGKPARSVSEAPHDSVLELRRADDEDRAKRGHRRPAYNPPNLWAYLEQTSKAAGPAPQHVYLEGWRSWLVLVLWLAAIAFAGWSVGGLIGDAWRWSLAACALLALAVDWAESLCNHRVALYPDDPGAERRRACLEALLYMRLVAFTGFLVGVGFGAFGVLCWILQGEASAQTWWLLGVDALMLTLGASFTWTGAPLTSAGMGSIEALQKAATPDEVAACLQRWAADERSEAGRGLLRPVVRSLWRDMFALIPTYTLVLFVGVWLALSLRLDLAGEKIWLEQLALTGPWWWIAAGLALACAVADYLEDALHLHFVSRYPQPVSRAGARVAFWAARVKFFLFITGLVLTTSASLWLAGSEVVEAFGHGCGFVRAVAVPIAILAPIAMIKERLAKRGEPVRA